MTILMIHTHSFPGPHSSLQMPDFLNVGQSIDWSKLDPNVRALSMAVFAGSSQMKDTNELTRMKLEIEREKLKLRRERANTNK